MAKNIACIAFTVSCSPEGHDLTYAPLRYSVTAL